MYVCMYVYTLLFKDDGILRYTLKLNLSPDISIIDRHTHAHRYTHIHMCACVCLCVRVRALMSFHSNVSSV